MTDTLREWLARNTMCPDPESSPLECFVDDRAEALGIEALGLLAEPTPELVEAIEKAAEDTLGLAVSEWAIREVLAALASALPEMVGRAQSGEG